MIFAANILVLICFLERELEKEQLMLLVRLLSPPIESLYTDDRNPSAGFATPPYNIALPELLLEERHKGWPLADSPLDPLWGPLNRANFEQDHSKMRTSRESQVVPSSPVSYATSIQRTLSHSRVPAACSLRGSK